MTGNIAFSGIASGLDTQAIISALVQAESIPINLLQQQKTGNQAKINGLNTFSGLVESLKKKAEELASNSGFLANSVTPSAEGFASFEALGGAADGAYTLEINQLAQADRWSAEGVVDKTTDLGGVNISFDYNGQAIEFEAFSGTSSLEEVAAQLNEEHGDVVQATVINTGDDNAPNYVLVLEGKDTGADYTIQNLDIVSGNGALDVDANLTVAQNAEIVLNGLAIERSSNEFSDVVTGLTFSVEAETPVGAPITFNVGIDDEAIVGSLQEFVNSYNAVMDFIATQSTYDEDKGAGGSLFGESSLRTIRSALSNTIYSSDLVDSTSAYGSIGLLGISLDINGKMTLDSAKAKSLLAEDPDAFADFFVDNDGFDNGGAATGTGEFYVDTSADKGLFSLISQKLDSLLDDQVSTGGSKLDGLLGSRKKTLEDQNTFIDKRIGELEYRLEGFESALVAQFTALEETLAGLQAQQQFLNNVSFGIQTDN
ncbi:flagellar filament capping protein FliD [Engelhardtia mirabilis]|uniref:Flagellar hook-associated protein 2 n=1 Tax=Engelhardtia mirabilis TaxID=2528011 RepID=A0A518BSR0_9BACT|nr:Flagellar hook-associated protein 2 [Planctomycetes bacterium Pla133]QDV04337.1 Flagellar hook-associated protein 2 [Planctomycetes bacterium Pla86]